jgi:hypothetical protein
MKTPDFSHFRKEPPPEFTNALFQKITTRRSFFFGAHTMFEKPFSIVRVSFILIVSLLIVGTCVQQVFTPRQVQVGDFWVHEMSKKFICAGDTVYPSYTPSSPMPTPQPQHAPTEIPTINLQELKQTLDFTLMIPTWAPEGFSLQQEYPMPDPFIRYGISWLSPNGTGITMMYFPETDWPTGKEIRVLHGAWKEVTVHNTPAVVVYGRCRFETWDDSVNWLYWSKGGVYYELFAMPVSNYQNQSDVDSEDLIRMAESAR